MCKQMPYFTYRVSELESGRKSVEYLDKFEKYRDARNIIREKRNDSSIEKPEEYRMIFAKNKTEAETLLTAPREERVIGED